MTVNNVAFHTYDANNGDVIDYTGSKYKVMNCYMDSGDDAVNFNAGMGADAAGRVPNDLHFMLALAPLAGPSNRAREGLVEGVFF